MSRRSRSRVPLSLAAFTVTTTLASGGTVVAHASTSQYYWKWSDGSLAASRSFDETDFRSASALPSLVVTARPSGPGKVVTLRFWSGGRWYVEDRAALNDAGTARISVNPLCESARWCDTTVRYRITVDGHTADARVTYRPRPAPMFGNAFE